MVPVVEWAQYRVPIEDAIQHVNSEGNFALLHAHCNMVKHDRDMEEFLDSVRNGDIVVDGSQTLAGVEDLRQRYLKTYAKVSAALRGKPLSPEHRAKSGAKKGKPKSPEHIAAVSAALSGKPKSLETCAKMSAARRGKPLSAEHRAKIGAAFRGKPLSPGHIVAMSAAIHEVWARPGYREKLSAAMGVALRGKPKSPEHRAAISAGWARRRERLENEKAA
jgi:hypothetical protein